MWCQVVRPAFSASSMENDRAGFYEATSGDRTMFASNSGFWRSAGGHAALRDAFLFRWRLRSGGRLGRQDLREQKAACADSSDAKRANRRLDRRMRLARRLICSGFEAIAISRINLLTGRMESKLRGATEDRLSAGISSGRGN